MLPPAGLPLEYWDLQLVPTGAPGQAGVVSVRTGRVLLTAAGIAEPLHFTRPFGLTWGEMLADGNLGELFLDFNNWGQRFDGLDVQPPRADPLRPTTRPSPTPTSGCPDRSASRSSGCTTSTSATPPT